MKNVGLTEIATLIPLGIVVIWIIYERLRPRKVGSSNVLIAGGRYPFLGNALEFLPERLFKTIENYSQMGDAVDFMLVGTRGVMISDSDTAREALSKRPKLFRRRKGFDYSAKKLGVTSGLFHSNGALWSRIRRGTAPSFSLLSMKKQYDPILSHVQAWITGLKEKAIKGEEVFDMKFETFQLTMRVVTVVAFGISLDDPINQYFFSAQCREDINYLFGYSIETLLSPIPKWAWRFTKQGALERRALAGTDRFTHHCAKVLTQKRQKIQSLGDTYSPDCMIETLMMRSDRNEDHLTDALVDEEIIANLKTFYLAGSDTTSVVLTWSFYVYSVYPEVLQKAREEVTAMLQSSSASSQQSAASGAANTASLLKSAELKWEDFQSLKYMQGVIKEILRLYGPTTGISMEPEHGLDSVTIGKDIKINAGDFIWINTDGIHLREQYFTNAQSFLPERWLTNDAAELQKMENAFLAFGHGPRACPGMNMAYMEAMIAVSLLAVTFDFKLACPAEEVKRTLNFSNSANKMPVILTAREFANNF